jgi:hypothetical protein
MFRMKSLFVAFTMSMVTSACSPSPSHGPKKKAAAVPQVHYAQPRAQIVAAAPRAEVNPSLGADPAQDSSIPLHQTSPTQSSNVPRAAPAEAGQVVAGQPTESSATTPAAAATLSTKALNSPQVKVAAAAAAQPANKETAIAAGDRTMQANAKPDTAAPNVPPGSAAKTSAPSVPSSEAPVEGTITKYDPQAPLATLITFEQNERWSPGLPREEVKTPVRTLKRSIVSGLEFTDGKLDKLMGELQKLDDKSKTKSENEQLSMRISDVTLQRSQKISLHLRIENGASPIELSLEGVNERPKSTLVEAKPSSDANFSYDSSVNCMDKNNSCSNAVIFLNRVSKKTHKVVSTAYIVYRVIEPIITTSDVKSTLPAHTRFDTLLNNAKFNWCIAKKPLATGDILKALERYCPGKAEKESEHARLTTWAVFNGHARYTFEILLNKNKKSQAILNFQGELVLFEPNTAAQKVEALTGTEIAAIESAELMANDGGGDLNFRVKFNGQPAEESRFSVTAMTKLSVHSVAAPLNVHSAGATAAPAVPQGGQ